MATLQPWQFAEDLLWDGGHQKLWGQDKVRALESSKLQVLEKGSVLKLQEPAFEASQALSTQYIVLHPFNGNRKTLASTFFHFTVYNQVITRNLEFLARWTQLLCQRWHSFDIWYFSAQAKRISFWWCVLICFGPGSVTANKKPKNVLLCSKTSSRGTRSSYWDFYSFELVTGIDNYCLQ